MNQFTKKASAMFLTAALWSGLSYANALMTYAAGDVPNVSQSDIAAETSLSNVINVISDDVYHEEFANEETAVAGASEVKAETAVTLAITKQPTDYTGAAGSQAKFKVEADGSGLSYQWQLSDDGTNWRNSSVKTAAYYVTLTAANNGRRVRCVVTDSNGKSVTSNAASMKIDGSLAITKQPTAFTGALGDQVTIKVEAQGSGLKYQWQLSDDAGKTWRNSSTKIATYSTKLTATNNGRFVRCVITDSNGKSVTSNAVSMKVASALQITKQPTSVTGAVGDQVTIKVEAQGDGLSYQWQLSDDAGKTWRNSSTKAAAYSTKLSTVNNGRLVRCIITDINGKSVTSGTAQMKVNSTIKLTKQPTDFTGALGAQVTIKVEAEGDGLNYQWQLSDDEGKTWRNSSTKAATYTTKLTTVNNGRLVRCIVTDSSGKSITSNAARMKAPTALKITKQPTNSYAALGGQVTFKVTAEGDGLKYQWQLSDDGGKTWRNSSIQTAVYATKLTQTNNNRTVRCIVTDSSGKSVTSGTAQMKTATEFKLTKQPISVTAALGDQVTITVGAQGDALSYQWQLSDDGGKTWRNSSTKTATYTTKLSTVNNNRFVRCIVTDYSGKSITSSTAQMKVAPTLKITKQPANYTGLPDTETKFTISAEGYGLKYLWQVSTDDGKTWVDISNVSESPEYAVYLDFEDRDNQYRCIITDFKGNTVTSQAASVAFTFNPPTITTQPKSYVGELDEAVEFTVEAKGYELSYQWQVSTDAGKTWSNVPDPQNDGDGQSDSYVVDMTFATHDNRYRCVITDFKGNKVTSMAAALTLVSNPLTITEQPADYVAEEETWASFNVDATGYGLTYQWQVSTDGGKTWKNVTKTNDDDDDGLSQDYSIFVYPKYNNYKYRCVVSDFKGNKITSKAVTLTLPSNPLTITEQPESQVADEDTLVTLCVEATGYDVSYQWQVSTDGGKTWKNVTKTNDDDDNGLEETYSVVVGTATHHHRYRCVVTDYAGNKLISNVATLTLTPNPLTITEQPEDYTAEEETWASFYITAQGYGLTYQWQVSTDSGKTWKNVTKTNSDDDDGKSEWYSILVSLSNNQQKYRCIVTDFQGNKLTSKTVTLTVNKNSDIVYIELPVLS